MWSQKLINPLLKRKEKPRSTGITMIMDKGLGINAFQDLLEIGSAYIDFIKLGFGTAAITPQPILQEKITLAKQYNIPIYPGGTFFEVAKTQNCLNSYFQSLLTFGFEWVEISDGSISLPLNERKCALDQAKEYGLHIITEIGKKAGTPLPPSMFFSLFEQDTLHGASYIIVEGREHGEKLRIFDEDGNLDLSFIETINNSIGSNRLIWEATKREQQTQLLQTIGSEVNFGNIPPYEVLSVEALRRGLRSDSFRDICPTSFI